MVEAPGDGLRAPVLSSVLEGVPNREGGQRLTTMPENHVPAERLQHGGQAFHVLGYTERGSESTQNVHALAL